MNKKVLAIIIVVATVLLGGAAVIAALRLREAEAPTAPKSKPKAAAGLSAIVEGPTIAKTADTLSYKATATGQKLAWVRIHWIESSADLSDPTKWGPALGANDSCNGTTSCTVSASLTPTSAGTQYITVVANDLNLGPCSGNPLVDNITDKNTSPVKGWIDCGPNDRISLSVSQAGDVLSENPFELGFSVQAAGATTPTPSPSPTPTPPAGAATPTPSPSPTPGFGGLTTPSPSPSPKAKASPSPIAKASPTPAPKEELPVAGVNVPTAVGIMGGIMLLLLGLALAL